MEGLREYSEWVENNRPDAPPSELPDDKELLKTMLDKWTLYHDDLYNNRYEDGIVLYRNVGINEVRIAKVHIKNLERQIRNVDKKRLEHGRNLVKTSVFIPRTTKEMLNIFPQRIIQEIIKSINTSRVLAKSPPKSSVPFYPPPSVIKSSLSVKKSVKAKSVKKDSDSISRNQTKEKLISIIMEQPDYAIHIEKTLQEISLTDANNTIRFFTGLGLGNYFSKSMKLPEKRSSIILLLKKLTDVNPRKIPLRVARNIEKFLGTRMGAKKNKGNTTRKLGD